MSQFHVGFARRDGAFALLPMLLVLGSALALLPAVAASSDDDKPEQDKNHKTAKQDESLRTAVQFFSANDRTFIRDYYRNPSSNLPPGLVKPDKLSPGFDRQLVRNGTLPRWLQKRIDPFPRELNLQLQPLPSDFARGLIGGSAVIVDPRNREIVDVIHNLLNNAGQ